MAPLKNRQSLLSADGWMARRGRCGRAPRRGGRGWFRERANLKSVTGTGRIWPIKFTASPDDTAGERQAALDYKAHGDRSSVPSGGGAGMIMSQETSTLVAPQVLLNNHLNPSVSYETFLQFSGSEFHGQ
jgi:hypothetical protein